MGPDRQRRHDEPCNRRNRQGQDYFLHAGIKQSGGAGNEQADPAGSGPSGLRVAEIASKPRGVVANSIAIVKMATMAAGVDPKMLEQVKTILRRDLKLGPHTPIADDMPFFGSDV